MGERIFIENLSEIEQHVWDASGIRHTLTPRAVVARSEEIATLFLLQKAKFVRKYVASMIPDIPGEAKVWIANMTGNPAQPKTLSYEQTDRKTGLTAHLTKPNPLATAITVSYKWDRGQKEGIGEDGMPTSWNLPKVTVKIPAGMRYPVAESLARWLLSSDAMQESDCRGRLMTCREPTEFEPNDSWDYDDIRLYAQLLDVGFDLKKAYPSTSALKNTGHEKHKEDLLQALFFYLVDERYSLPPKHAFDALKKEKESKGASASA